MSREEFISYLKESISNKREADLPELISIYSKDFRKYYRIKLDSDEMERLVLVLHPKTIEPFTNEYGISKAEFDKNRILVWMVNKIKPKLSRFCEYSWYSSIVNEDIIKDDHPIILRDTWNNEPRGSFYVEDGAHRLLGKALKYGFDFNLEAYLAQR